MRFLPLILLLALVAGCVTEWHPAMPNASKYENNPQAYHAYMHFFGVGFQYGWEMPTVDMTSWQLTNAASIDGFNDGERAAWKVRTEEARERKARVTQPPNTSPER